MNESARQFEHLEFAGPVSAVVTVLMGLALAGLFIWSLRLERKILGSRLTALFCVLRIVALSVALWMLLAPSKVRYEESVTPRTIAMITDVSDSMLTIDPLETATDQKWRAPNSSLITAIADRAFVAATLAEQRLERATQALRSQQDEQEALNDAARAYDAIARLQLHLTGIDDQVRDADQPQWTARLEEIEELLTSENVRRLKRLAENVRRERGTHEVGWRESLEDLRYQISLVRRRVGTLQADLVDPPEFDDAHIENTQPATRWTKTQAFLAQLESQQLTSLRESAEVRLGAFAEELNWYSGVDQLPVPQGQTPAGESESSPQRITSTNLSQTLEQLRELQRERSLSAVILIGDLAHNSDDERDPRKIAGALGDTPVYVVPIGSTSNLRDVDLKAISVPGVVMKDDDVVIEATLQTYQCLGETIHVELMQDGQVIQDREVEIETDEELVRVRFHANLDEVGLQQFQVRVVPVADELSEMNNFNQFEVNVTRDHIDLLLADDLPRWEYRYLAQLFRRDPKVQCDELLFHPRRIATGHRKPTGTFPTTVDDWDRYDVVLLGDVTSQELTIESQNSLNEYLRERGGTLVLIAGENAMPQAFVNQPLEETLPVSSGASTSRLHSQDGYAFRLTDAGWEHDALMIADTENSTRIAWEFISRNAPFSYLSPYRIPKPAARTLIAAVDWSDIDAEEELGREAFLCWQQYGRGRVVFLASPESYRLRFLRGDRLHYRFWGQMLRWAIASDLAIGTERVAIRTDRSSYASGQSIEVSVQLQDEQSEPVIGAAVAAMARSADGALSQIPLIEEASQPGHYRGTFESLPHGVYQVEVQGDVIEQLLLSDGTESQTMAAPMASFTVQTPIQREILDTKSDRALAQQIAEITGGAVLPPTAVNEVIELTNLEPVVTKTSEVTPLWVQWKYLWIVFGCLFTEWAIRKQLGLS